jgi:hypothetical protein
MKPEVKEFREQLILHHNFKLTADRVLHHIYEDAEHPIIQVVGPPGVGKTSMIRYVLSAIVDRERENMEKDREYIPAIGAAVPAPETRSFPWKNFYHTMIEALFDPAARAGVHFREYQTKDKQRDLGFEFPTEKYIGKGTKQTLYRHFLRILEHRRPKAILLDEAHHFVFGVRNVADRRELLANRIKSIADDMCGAKLVLFGTYKTQKITDSTNQGVRRLITEEFRRYDEPDTTDTSDLFLVTLASFNNALDGRLQFDPIDHAEELYLGCLGCVGLLKSWFETALTESEDGKISWELMTKTRMRKKLLSKARDEIFQGEAYMASLDESDESDKSLWSQFAPKAMKPKKRGQANKFPFQANPRAHKKGFNHG